MYAGRASWNHDFGGEQFSLGRAFYTHFEEGRTRAYFADVASSDATVEAHAPGLQAAMRELVARAVGGARVVGRRGWCGPGVHVFPPEGPVATHGGVVHFDTEGLAANHVRVRRPALTIVAVLQAAEADRGGGGGGGGGGLRIWDVLYGGRDHPGEDELRRPSEVIPYGAGDVVIFESYLLHQIQPFEGARDRISATVHAAQIDTNVWECWF